MLYIALSSLQGQPAYQAAQELLSLAPGALGLQLTPGCAPTEPDPSTIQCPQRTHHGYTPNALRARVWDSHARLIWKGDSVHPPLQKETDFISGSWFYTQCGFQSTRVLETMYPGYAWLTCGDEIERGMRNNFHLAVDVSHLAIQSRQGLLSVSQCKRLFDYDKISEVHVSRSVGQKDAHMPLALDGSDFGIAWAKERLRAGTPVVMEAYMHRLSEDERKQQVGVMLG